ncbi:MAG: (Fe-S)-binding protein [Pseudomonadota bacterium]
MSPAPPPIIRTLLAAADQCVLCGLCSAQCPTYGLYQIESESPRGRIVLIQALLKGQLAPDAATRSYLDHCLSCRRCEAQCPSGVPYGQLIDGVKAWVPGAATRRRTWAMTLLTRAPTLRAALRRLVSFLPAMLLPKWAAVIKHYARRSTHATPTPSSPPRIMLFTGCITELADQAAVHAVQRLCAALGVEIATPATAHCCGALALHSGQHAQWQALMYANGAQLNHQYDQLLGLTPGCTAALLEYAHSDHPAARALAGKVADVGTYLAHHPRWASLRFRSTPKRVGIHLPCTQRNVLKDHRSTSFLLQSIPGLELIALPELPACCGAAGTHMLYFSQQAQALRAPLLDFIRAQRLDYVVSTNIGCALHVTEGLWNDTPPVRVLHPLTLLAEALA